MALPWLLCLLQTDSMGLLKIAMNRRIMVLLTWRRASQSYIDTGVVTSVTQSSMVCPTFWSIETEVKTSPLTPDVKNVLIM